MGTRFVGHPLYRGTTSVGIGHVDFQQTNSDLQQFFCLLAIRDGSDLLCQHHSLYHASFRNSFHLIRLWPCIPFHQGGDPLTESLIAGKQPLPMTKPTCRVQRPAVFQQIWQDASFLRIGNCHTHPHLEVRS